MSEERPAAGRVRTVPFNAQIELLRSFLARRGEIVERIEQLLNARRRPAQSPQTASPLARDFEDCFFGIAGVTADQAALRRELDEAHWASGFKPRETPGQHNDLIDPAEMMSRGVHLWQRTRWPGRHDRVRYAHTLLNLYLLRRLMLLCMRLWDAGSTSAGDRLSQIQSVLDELWRATPKDQPVFVRDARWLLPLAQSPTTDELHGYFEVAERVASSLPEADRIEIHKASVRMAGGHLRSQLRHVSTQNGVSLDDHSLVVSTRKSNALDLATLIQALVPLLAAYEHSLHSGNGEKRLELADSICQGVSPDPELFLNRLDLLGPYSMIEHLFVATDRDENAAYTPAGQRHLELLEEYRARIARVSGQLHQDCSQFRPIDGAYSPYGVLYGFSSRLLEHMALKALSGSAVAPFSLEDAFTRGDADKLAWVSGWRKLPHVPREVLKRFEYPQRFAEEIFERIERALRQRAGDGEANAAVRDGRLLVEPVGDPRAGSQASSLPDLPTRFIVSSDRRLVAAGKAHPCDETQLLHSRLEGEFVVSHRTPGGWLAISKDILTEVLGAGQDAKVGGLPRAAAGALQLMCADHVIRYAPTPHRDGSVRPDGERR
jgi:hypothetical protein